MKRPLPLILFLSILLSACNVHAFAQADMPTAIPGTPTSPLDRCAPIHLTAEIVRVNKLMDEFDHYASRAAESGQSELIQFIPEMQRILRDAQDQEIPACLQSLKELQTAHMNSMILVLIYLHGRPISNTPPDPNVITYVNAGLTQARDLHEKYDIELSRLLDNALISPTPASDVAITVNRLAMAPGTIVIAAIITFLGLLWVVTGQQLIKHTKQTHALMLSAQEKLDGKGLQNIHELTPSSASNDDRVLELTREKEHIIETYEEARKKLAYQVHAGPIQTIADMAFRLNTTKHTIKRDVHAAIEEIVKLEELAQSAIQEISRMPVLLRPLTLESHGLTGTLQIMADRMKEIYDQRVIFNVDADTSNQLDLDKQNLIFHIIEEAVENACKYASAEIIAIRLLQTEEDLATLQIVDNGIGFDIDNNTAMYNLRERAKLVQGLLQVDSIPGQGTIVQVHIPLSEAITDHLHYIE